MKCNQTREKNRVKTDKELQKARETDKYWKRKRDRKSNIQNIKKENSQKEKVGKNKR